MNLDVHQIEDFAVLAETGNFSRAAALRHVTQPAFSRRIRALEDWAGAALFDRDAQPIALTPAGEALRPFLVDVLRGLRAGRDAARAAADRARVTLRFAATHALSFTFFPGWLRGLEGEAPPASVSLVSDSLEACEALMLNGGAQFLLCHGHDATPARLDPARFTTHRIGGDVLVPVTASGMAACGENALPFLAYSPESGLGRVLATALPARWAARLDPVFTAHQAAALRSMARTGRGVAWLPATLVAEDLASGVLRRAGDAPEVPLTILLIRPAAALGATGEAFWAVATRGGPRPDQAASAPSQTRAQKSG